MSWSVYQGYGIQFMKDRARPTGWLLRARIHWHALGGGAFCDIYPLAPVVVPTREEAEARSLRMAMLAIDRGELQ